MQAEDPKGFSQFMASPARFFGKDPDEFRQCVLGAFEAAMREASGSRIAIFAHGMTIKTILCAALRTEEAYARLLINHCSVSRLSGSTPGRLRVDSINESLCKPVKRA